MIYCSYLKGVFLKLLPIKRFSSKKTGEQLIETEKHWQKQKVIVKECFLPSCTVRKFTFPNRSSWALSGGYSFCCFKYSLYYLSIIQAAVMV